MPLWFVAAFAGGIAAWLWLPGPAQWSAFIVLALAMALGGLAWGQGRLGRALLLGGLALAAGCALIWGASEWVAAPRLERPVDRHARGARSSGSSSSSPRATCA